MFILFMILGAFGGFASGLLGVGGAVIMIPLMLNIPPLFGFSELSMQAISGLSIIQVFFSSISGIIRHNKNRLIHRQALLFIGTTMAGGSLIGVMLSRIASSSVLLIAFGALVIIAFAMMLIKPPTHLEHGGSEHPVSVPLSLLIGSSVGLLSGMVGAGGGFILIPLMIYILRIPTKTAIGTSLGIVFIGSISGAIGKAVAGQVEWMLALALVIGAIPFAQLGASVSRKVSSAVLRILLIVVILATCVQTWLRILQTIGLY